LVSTLSEISFSCGLAVFIDIISRGDSDEWLFAVNSLFRMSQEKKHEKGLINLKKLLFD